jgi:hypothetical protein
MTSQPARRLYQKTDLCNLLQLPEPKIDWLIRTGQLQPLIICGETRFDSADIAELINTYLAVAKRKN